MNFGEKYFNLDKKWFFYEPEKNPIFLRSTRAAHHKIDVLRVVT